MIQYQVTFTIETTEKNDIAVEEAMTKALDEAIPCAGDAFVIRIQDHGGEVAVHDLYGVRVAMVTGGGPR